MRRRGLIPYVFTLPFMVTFTVFLIVPVGYAVYLSLFEVRHQPLVPDVRVFAPTANYARAFGDNEFLTSLANIAKYAVIQVPAMVIFALIIALVLDAGEGRLRRWLRLAVFIPYAIPGVIAGIMWSYLYARNVSPINQIVQALGFEPINFIDSSIILGSIANIIVWVATGYNAVILYASLRNIPQELYDAAMVDGARNWQVIRYVKMPMLRPTLVLATIFSVIGAMQIFGEPYVLRSLGFIPGDITPNTVIYNAATRDANFYYAAALAIILAFVTFTASILFLWLTTRERSKA